MVATLTNILKTPGREAAGRAAGFALAATLSLGLAACGAGAADLGASQPIVVSSGPQAGTSDLTITTLALPAGRPLEAYPSITLTTSGASGPVVWSLAHGTLPEGLTLRDDGCLTGVPTRESVATFAVRATCGTQAAERTFGLAIGAFGLVASDGLLAGTAWTDAPVSLSCVGAAGVVRFEVVASGSGGGFASTDEQAGLATWRPGPVGGGAIDTLRAVDLATGAHADVTFAVQRDPTAGYQAEFGRSDVWYVDTTRKLGDHAYATDLHHTLAEAGLRAATSTDRLGTAADRLAELCVRVALLRNLNRFYLRNEDGSRGAGLPISFSWSEPAGYLRAPDGGWISGGADRYSVIGVVHGSQPGVVGTAFTDGAANGSHETDVTAGGAGELGVFANRFVETVNYAWNNLALAWDPVGVADVQALEALLYGLPSPGGRYETIHNGVEALGRSLAAVAAHEIGHSLGLAHTSPSVPGSLMNSSGVFAPGIAYAFTPEALAQLRGALPGLGRSSGAAKYATAASGPEGGLAVCEGRERCNLMLAPCDCAAHRRAARPRIAR